MLAWQSACQAGRCRYPAPSRPPDPGLGALGCIGYTATAHLEDGAVVLRWVLCPRHRAWWAAERVRIRERRRREKEATSPSVRAMRAPAAREEDGPAWD